MLLLRFGRWANQHGAGAFVSDCQTVGVPCSPDEAVSTLNVSRPIPIQWSSPDEWWNALREFDVADSRSDSLERVVGRYFVDIQEVVEVYFAQEADVLDVWTIVAVNTSAIRRRVYAQEALIIRHLPRVMLNFRVSGLAGASAPASAGYRKIDMTRLRADAQHQRTSFKS